MEQMQVQVTSVETIKPSTPTPHHLNSYKFCLLDQLFPLIYVPQVLFYSNPIHDNNPLSKNDPTQNILTRLKDALSKSLSLFYPLAGRLAEDESSINCNDKGIPFVEARAKGTLHAFLKDPNRIKSLPSFIPHDIYDHSSRSSSSRSSTSGQPLKVTDLLPLVLQVTTFDCGGIAIGYQKLHKIVDGGSWGTFLETWAALARGRDEGVVTVVTPDFATALSLFPSCNWAIPPPGTRSIILNPFDVKEGASKGCTVKAFGFSACAIAALQAQARSEHVRNPTRVEAISGFIWKHAMAAATTASTTSKRRAPSVLIHTVNMRPCSRPKLPPAAIGNLITHAVACFKDIDTPPAELELKDLVAEIRRCISEAKDDKFLSKFQGKEGGNFVREHMKKMMSIYEDVNINPYKFTSWSRNGLGLNSDFGFRIPVWIGYTGGRVNSLLRNFIALIGTIDNGIEAWLVLDETEIGILESDSQFLAFAPPIN